MKKITNKAMLILLTAFALSSNAAQAPQVKESSLLCDFFGINCPVNTTKGGGDGKEPPKDT